jgi:hypothetical protein
VCDSTWILVGSMAMGRFRKARVVGREVRATPS